MHKGKSQSYGSYILDNKDELLKRKKRIIRAKKTALFMIILVAVLITLCFTLPIFNIKDISISGNSTVSSEEIKMVMGVADGQNIFKFRKDAAVKELVSNPYISKAEIKRKLPNSIEVNVEERNIAFCIQADDGFYVIDEEGVFLEKRDNIDDISLVGIVGIDTSGESLEIGKPIIESEEKLKSLTTIYRFLKVNGLFEKYSVHSIEINDFVGMKIYINNFYVKVGTTDDMFEKLSKAFNIIENSNLADLNGYLDVSFNGNPVIYKNPEE